MTRIVTSWMVVLLLLVVTVSIGQTAEVGRADNQGAAVDVAMAAAIFESVLWSFGANDDGVNPFASLIFDPRGNLYGTTTGGGTIGHGTVFKLIPPRGSQPQWSERVLWNFGANDDGRQPFAGLIFDARGNLYGTTASGGTNDQGTVFELSPPRGSPTQWSERVLWNFGANKDGELPFAGLIFDPRGNLYGTTTGGGTNDQGTVFKLIPPRGSQMQWSERVLWNFGGPPDDGRQPFAGLIFDPRGNLYSTTASGGTNDQGTVFKLSPPRGSQPQWSERVLWNFGANDDGRQPFAGLIFDRLGNLYSTTAAGGANNCSAFGFSHGCGTVFKLIPPGGSQPQWSERVLWNFGGPPNDGLEPSAGLIFDRLGNLYSTTAAGGANKCSAFGFSPGCGTVFKLSPPRGSQTQWSERVLWNFGANDDGVNPLAGLIFDRLGNLYCTTQFGGINNDGGTVFQLSVPPG